MAASNIIYITESETGSRANGAGHKMDVERNPHPDFKSVEDSRPPFDNSQHFRYTKTPDPNWQWGQGANDEGSSLQIPHVEINPYAEGRPSTYNYKLLISGIVPRPIGLLSTISIDGTLSPFEFAIPPFIYSIRIGKSPNLAPYSFTQVVNSDPPIFVVGVTGNPEAAKDTLGNLMDTKECEISRIFGTSKCCGNDG
jgi:hypothetical protein